jgi:hypothetical protein
MLYMYTIFIDPDHGPIDFLDDLFIYFYFSALKMCPLKGYNRIVDIQ